MGRGPGSLTWHQVPPLCPQELETQELVSDLLYRWPLTAEEVSCKMDSGDGNPGPCDARCGPGRPTAWSVGQQGCRDRDGTEVTMGASHGQRKRTQASQGTLATHPTHPHFLLPFCAEALALSRSMAPCSIAWWLSTRTEGKHPELESWLSPFKL